MEKIFADSKKINVAQSVFHIFNEFDPSKTGYVEFQDFKFAIEEKLNCRDMKLLDLQFLAK